MTQGKSRETRPRRGTARFWRDAAMAIMLAAFAAACSSPAASGGKVSTEVRTDLTPASVAAGERSYGIYCVRCHGERGMGTPNGPTFLTPIYAPNHHSDQAFVLAARQGVSPHHWTFGPMPPIPGVSDVDLQEIVKYVRWVQGLQ
ncbi:MAG: cytochrome c [Chloroflexi bacterium]|nr:cytochrome c [Chloroflexota bacterium]